MNIWSTFQYHQVIESAQNLLRVKSVAASLDYGLKLLWADTQNLSSAFPTLSVILDLWLMPFDNKLVLKEYLLWCSGLFSQFYIVRKKSITGLCIFHS